MARDRDEGPPTIAEFFAQQFAEAVTDVRRRVVEEPWFGKPLDGPTGGVDGSLYSREKTPETDLMASGWMRDSATTPQPLEAAETEALPAPEEPDRGMDL